MNKYWTPTLIERQGFKLITNHNGWCHFKGDRFEITINLKRTDRHNGNYFNFKSVKGKFHGHFRAVINTVEEFQQLMIMIQ